MVVKESVKAKFLRINKMSAIKVCLSCVSGVYGRSYSCNGVKKCDGHAAWRDSEICDKPADSFIFFFLLQLPRGRVQGLHVGRRMVCMVRMT